MLALKCANVYLGAWILKKITFPYHIILTERENKREKVSEIDKERERDKTVQWVKQIEIEIERECERESVRERERER